MNFISLLLLACCTVGQKTTHSTKTKTEKNINTTVTSVTTLVTISTPSLESETVDVNDTIETTSPATCEANSSCLVEPNSNGTLTEANANITRNNLKDRYDRTDFSLSGNEMCTCDLGLNICDINCCCDQDCSRENRLVFHHCEFENVYYDTRYCDYMKYIYVNNTPFQWHVNQNGLFCVLKSNLPPSYTTQRRQPLMSFEAAQQENLNKFSWSRATKKKEVNFSMTEEFVYGNHIWTIHKNEIKIFQVPKKLFSSSCLAKDDVLNLKNVNSICAQIDISEENRYLHFKNYFQNVAFVSNPNFFNISKFKNLQGCPKNICLAVLPKICDRNFNNCQNISKNDSRVEVKCNFYIRLNRNDCKNVVNALQYHFYHNGTQGFTKIEILGVLEDLSFEFGTDFEYFQEFKVNFWWTNQTRNFSTMFSGNPGYIIGKPILSGNMVIVGNSTNATTKIERFSNDYLKNFLVLPKNVDGNCVLSQADHLSIEFGYNLQTKCKHRATVVNRKKYHNATEICRELQSTILKMWGVTSKNKTVGMFGNANANVPKEWTKIIYSLSIEKLFNKTTGRFNSGNTTLNCFGLVNDLVVDVYHSRIDFKNLRDQEKILAVTYSFEGFVNKSMPYNKKGNSTYLELNLESSVAFYDISAVKQQKFVDRPSLEIRLPYDFFYPFIKIDNGSETWFICNYFHVFLCLVVLLMK